MQEIATLDGFEADTDVGDGLPAQDSRPAVPAPPARADAVMLTSAFQPIFSLSHQRLIGHEALLRATSADGGAVSPLAMFERCDGDTARQLLDRRCRTQHIAEFARQPNGAQWLFLNVDASAFIAADVDNSIADSLLATTSQHGFAPSRIVLELLETALPAEHGIDARIEALRKSGFLLALDDFGAGHSNFDRVFRLRPHIVKLDRSVIARAASDTAVQRITAQMISLLHECGALVLVEGIETKQEAAIALDANADLVQGYYFGRPNELLRDLHARSPAVSDVWDSCDDRYRLESTAYDKRLRPYTAAVLRARDMLQAGAALDDACVEFLLLDRADVCYLLDDAGTQVERNIAPALSEASRATAAVQFAPLSDARGARWSRRPYFRRAVAAPGELQVTRPYPTVRKHQICVTLSVCFRRGADQLVLCADVIWA